MSATALRLLAVVAPLLAVAALLGGGARAESAGPIAISMMEPPLAVVLRVDGRVVSFDTRKGAPGKQVYRVPRDFQATDLAAANTKHGPVICLVLNARSAAKYSSFVMQLFADGRQVWTWLPTQGVYIGVALDADGRYAYATNSTTNAIYRIEIGDEKAPVIETAVIGGAERLGPIAVDGPGRRLFAVDMLGGRLYVATLTAGSYRMIELPGAGELRAVTWAPSPPRLFVADAGQELVWAVDPDGRSEPLRIRDHRLREPSGLALAWDGVVWGVDEAARSVFRLDSERNAVARVVPLD